MKKLLVAMLATVASSGIAAAADLGVYTKAPIAPATYDWTGLYVGGHIGGGWSSTDIGDSSSSQLLANCCTYSYLNSGPATQSIHSSSFLGGVQGGMNYQIGRLVLGSDFDFSWMSLNGSNSAGLPAFPGYAQYVYDTETVGAKANWTGTATTRLGLAKDNWMLYGKAGAAWANYTYSLAHAGGYYVNYYDPGEYPPFAFGATTSETRIGWTLGTGVEWAFARNWTARLEYDYMNFGTKPESFSGAVTGGYNGYEYKTALPLNISTNIYSQISEVKFGINYKFDSGFLFW